MMFNMSAVKYVSQTFPQMSYVCLVIMLLILEVSPQQIHLDPFNPADTNTDCPDGSVIGGLHRIIFRGTVDVGTSSLFPRTFTFLRNTTVNSIVTEDCFVYADRDGCHGYLDLRCYCQDNSTGIYKVVYNITAAETFNGGIAELFFDGIYADSSMPKIRSVEKVSVTVSEGGTSVSLPESSICSQSFIAGRAYDFEICARNLENADVYIRIDGYPITPNTTINDCTSFINVELLNTARNLTFGYQEATGCERGNSWNCTITGKDDDDDLLIILYIFIGILLAIASGALVWFCFWMCYPDERVLCCCKKTSICCCNRKTVCCFKKTPADCCMTSKTEPEDDVQTDHEKASPTEHTFMARVTLKNPGEHGAKTQRKTKETQPQKANGQDSYGKEGSVETADNTDL